jgi:S-formylglutathione hydrolase FrmB
MNAETSRIKLKKFIIWISVGIAILLLIAVLKSRPEKEIEIPGVQRVTFRSRALDRVMNYWVVLPGNYQNDPSQQYPVLYMLHGHGGAPTESIQNSHLLEYIRPQHWILVMPDGKDSYYTNAAEKPADKFEDYVVQDVVSEVESKFRAIPKREGRMLAGISMGGFGAEKIGLRHPGTYLLIGALSSPADATRRKFSYRRPLNSYVFWKDFGPMDSQTRRDNDPFTLVNEKKQSLPFFYLGCGTQDNLAAVDRRLAAAFEKNGIPHVYQELPGGHDWQYWDVALANMVAEFNRQLATSN